MLKVYGLKEIELALRSANIIDAVEQGFRAYSNGEVITPPIGELLLPEHNGELHIKYGAIRGQDTIVIKVASGFFNNSALNLPSYDGCLLVLSQSTGQLKAMLADQGELTNHRTGAAGAIAAKHLAPKSINTIGIIGAGTQAKIQAEYLREVTPCRKVLVWARSTDKADACCDDLKQLGFHAKAATNVKELCAGSQLIVTTTAAKSPLISADMIQPGTHITAIGSDTHSKIELEPSLLNRADHVVCDSLNQCQLRGEIHHALRAGLLELSRLTEIGKIIDQASLFRTNQAQITIADFTGLAAQDIAIATAILDTIEN